MASGCVFSSNKKHTVEELIDAQAENCSQDDNARRHLASHHSSNTNNQSPNQKGEIDGPLPGGLGMEPGAEIGLPDVEPRRKHLLLLVLAPIKYEPECYTRFGKAEFSGEDGKHKAYIEYVGSRDWRTITIY